MVHFGALFGLLSISNSSRRSRDFSPITIARLTVIGNGLPSVRAALANEDNRTAERTWKSRFSSRMGLHSYSEHQSRSAFGGSSVTALRHRGHGCLFCLFSLGR